MSILGRTREKVIMLRIVVGFMKGLMTLPGPWRIWVGALISVNLFLPLAFLGSLEGRVVLAAFLLAAGVQMILFRARGFVRLLGVGHLPWVPLLIWIAYRLPVIGTDSALGTWLAVLMVLNGVSLVIDAIDVIRYVRGERQPAFALQS